MGVANMLGRIFCGATSVNPDINPMVVTYITLTLGGITVLMSTFSRTLMSHVIMVITFGTCVGWYYCATYMVENFQHKLLDPAQYIERLSEI